MHKLNCFVTLTYDDAHLHPSLNPDHLRVFIKELRRHCRREDKRNCAAADNFRKIRYFACGEYGEMSWRPHFHVLVFGHYFDDGVPCGKDIFSSRTLSKLWKYGFSSFGAVTFESAAYVSGYVLKKVNGRKAAAHYERMDVESGEIYSLKPEFARMSLKPGIGYEWFKRYWTDVYVPRDGVPMEGGRVVPPPRYYDVLLSQMDEGLLQARKDARLERAKAFAADCTPERLKVREACAVARNQFKQRVI